MKKEKLRLYCLTGIFTAVVYVFTAYLHIPSHSGYTHIGDGFIYLSACLLPLPYAVFTGAFGALMADCFTGFAIWAPASVIIKSVTVLFFTAKPQKILSIRNLIAPLPSAICCAGGYYLYDMLITGSPAAAISGIPGYITQSLLSSVLFLLLSASLDRLNIKQKLMNGERKL